MQNAHLIYMYIAETFSSIRKIICLNQFTFWYHGNQNLPDIICIGSDTVDKSVPHDVTEQEQEESHCFHFIEIVEYLMLKAWKYLHINNIWMPSKINKLCTELMMVNTNIYAL